MKPANFPGRSAHRKQSAATRASGGHDDRTSRVQEIADITIRHGARGRYADGTAMEGSQPNASKAQRTGDTRRGGVAS